MVFTGTYEHAIDSKQRLAIPSDVRAQIKGAGKAKKDQPTGVYVMLGEGATLCLYTESGFEQRAAELDASELDASELLEYERVMFSLARRVEIDPQGRIRLPDNLLKMAGLGSEVVLIGVKDHLEIRDRAQWHEHLQKILTQQPHLLMNPRRAMRRRPGSES